MLSLKNIIIWICCVIAALVVSGLWISNPLIGFANGVAWGLIAIILCE